MNQINRCKILLIFSNTYSNVKTELIFSSQFELLISVMLSSKTTDRIVNLVTKNFFSIANTPSSILSLGLQIIKKNIRKVGLYNRKSEYIFRICQILLDKYDGNVPNTREDLESLPGIGRKTANVILNILFQKKTIAVDTHVFRVCNRIGFVTGKTVWEIEQKLLKTVPNKFKLNCHLWFVFHGKYICTFNKPNCLKCTINNLCEFKNKNL